VAKRQRKYRLEIQNVYGLTTIIEPPFTIDFDIKKAIFANVCTGSITVYNLGERTRNEIYKDVTQVNLENIRAVELFAGYEGEQLPRIFGGTISHCYSRRQGVDFLTTIEVNSGSDYLANSYVNLDVPKGTKVSDMMAQVAYQINPKARVLVGDYAGEFKRACSLCGPADKIIKDYTGGNFFIDDDTIFLLSDDECVNGVLNEFNAESGLLGSPQREETFLVFDVIFEPRVSMFQKIKLTSSTTDFFNGEFKVVGIHHVGTISEAIGGTAKTSIRVEFFKALGTIVK